MTMLDLNQIHTDNAALAAFLQTQFGNDWQTIIHSNNLLTEIIKNTNSELAKASELSHDAKKGFVSIMLDNEAFVAVLGEETIVQLKTKIGTLEASTEKTVRALQSQQTVVTPSTENDGEVTNEITNNTVVNDGQPVTNIHVDDSIKTVIQKDDIPTHKDNENDNNDITSDVEEDIKQEVSESNDKSTTPIQPIQPPLFDNNDENLINNEIKQVQTSESNDSPTTPLPDKDDETPSDNEFANSVNNANPLNDVATSNPTKPNDLETEPADKDVQKSSGDDDKIKNEEVEQPPAKQASRASLRRASSGENSPLTQATKSTRARPVIKPSDRTTSETTPASQTDASTTPSPIDPPAPSKEPPVVSTPPSQERTPAIDPSENDDDIPF